MRIIIHSSPLLFFRPLVSMDFILIFFSLSFLFMGADVCCVHVSGRI